MRGAPRLVATSDVTRFRGIALADAVAADGDAVQAALPRVRALVDRARGA